MKNPKAILVSGLLVSLSCCPMGNAQIESSPDRTVPAGQVDEAYFLARTLESLYGQWPQDLADPAQFEAATVELRREAINFRSRAESAGLPIEIVKGYADFVALLDSFVAFLTDVGAIERRSDGEILQQHTNSAIGAGGSTAVTTFSGLRQTGNFTNTEAAAGALLAGGIMYAVDAWSKTSEMEASRKAEIRARAKRMDDTTQATISQTAHALMALAEKRGWSASELGWNLSPAQSESVMRMIETEDLNGLINEFRRQATERPRDPFIQLGLIALLAFQDNLDAEAYSQVANQALGAANLVPSAPVYHHFRQAFLSQAAAAAVKASIAERIERELGLQSTMKSRRALELAEKAYEINSSDPTGQLRILRALALLENNDLEAAFNQVRALPEEFQSFGTIRLLAACIFSRGQMPDEALVELEAAVKSGEVVISEIPKDPNLIPLKNARSEQFQQLVTPDWSWTVTDDLVFDDVVLQNDSVFPITNVTFTLTLRKGETVKTVEVHCDVVKSGEKMVWRDAVVGVSGHWDIGSSSVSLWCDQFPGK